MNKLFSATLLLPFFYCGCAHAETISRDIQYGSNARNQLDLYMPDNVKNPPLVVFIHGGRWFRNDKTQVKLYGRIKSLMDAGIALASINYTYSKQKIWPAQIEDIQKAIVFLHQNATHYGFNPDKIAVWGQSSGAHLALWAGLLSAQSSEATIKAVVSWYAPSNLYQLDSDRQHDANKGKTAVKTEREKATASHASPESILIGKSVHDHKDAADAASPEVYIANLPKNERLPDFLLMHGTADPVVSPRQTQRLYTALQQQGGTKHVELIYVDGAGHGGPLFKPYIKDVVEFLRQEFTEKEAPN